MKAKDFLKLPGRLIWAKFTSRRVPFQMHIRVIDRCNLHCKYCFGDYPVRNLPPPTTDQLLKVMDGLKRLGTLRVTLTGGEPLLRDDIHEIVRRARANDIEPSLTTNGALIDRHPELLKDLAQLTVSVDGGREIHDANRGEGSWEKAIHAVRKGREAGTPVQLLCTVTKLSTEGLKDVFEIADRYDCAVTFDLVAPLYQPDGTMSVRPQARSDREIQALLDSLLALNHPRAVFSPAVLRYIRSWPVSYKTYRLFRDQIPDGFKPIPCAAGRFFAIIETNGNLLPCCRIGSEYSPPNVYELGVEEAWRRLPGHDCAACIQVGGNMFNSLFALQPGTVSHFLRQSLRRENK